MISKIDANFPIILVKHSVADNVKGKSWLYLQSTTSSSCLRFTDESKAIQVSTPDLPSVSRMLVGHMLQG